MSTHHKTPVRADDAGKAMEADQHASVTADRVEQVQQRQRRPTQRSGPGHVTRGYGGRQRNDEAGRDDVQQIGDGEIGDQRVVDRPQQTIARENGQQERVERHRQSSDDHHHARHHVIAWT